jgi:hypothetical protein
MLVLIMAVSAVTHGEGKSSGKAELQEHYAALGASVFITCFNVMRKELR